LLDDVERLRRAVIAAREEPPDAADRAGDGIAALVAGWPLARAELVAKSFTIYFHLTNLAEERHRVRTLRGQADLAQEKWGGGAPVRHWPPRWRSSAPNPASSTT